MDTTQSSSAVVHDARTDLDEYTRRPSDPDLVTRVFRAIWNDRGAAVGTTFEVTDCPFSADELSSLHRDGRRVGYLPRELATQSTRPRLGEIFPKLRCYSVLAHNVVTNDENPFGWFDYEIAIDCPYRHTNEAQLVEQVRNEGRALLTVNQYIVAGQDSRIITGHYLDEVRTWARTGSKVDGHMVSARFDGDEVAEGLGDEVPAEGSLIVGYDLGSEATGPITGGRTTTLSAHRRLVPASAAELLPSYDLDLAYAAKEWDEEAEWSRITDRYLRAGFHIELGMSRDEYLLSLPHFGAQPGEYRGRLDIPMVIETRIPWKRQAELIGMRIAGFDAILPPEGLDADSIANVFHPIDDATRIPDRPYAAWFNKWGQRFPDPIAPADSRAQLADDELGGNVHELVAMELAYPELNRNARYFESIGYVIPARSVSGMTSHSALVRTAAVWRPRGVAEVAANLNPRSYSMHRPLVRGAKIVTDASRRAP